MQQLSLDDIRRLPKTDLHVHLDGSLRIPTILELARDQGVQLPGDTVETLRPFVEMGEDCASLVEYLKAFDVTLAVMQTYESLVRTAYELAEDSAQENVRYLEVRYSPILHQKQGLTLFNVVQAVAGGPGGGGAALPHPHWGDPVRDPPHRPGPVQPARRPDRRLQEQGRGRVRPGRRGGGLPGQEAPGRLQPGAGQQHQLHPPRRRGVWSRKHPPGHPPVRRPPHRPRGAPDRGRRPAQLCERPPHPPGMLPLLQRPDQGGAHPGRPPDPAVLRPRPAGGP